MESKNFYIAGMSESASGGIFRCRYDGVVFETVDFTPLERCLFLAWGKDRKTLYATAQYNGVGKIAAYRVAHDGKLTLLDMVDAGGQSACFLAVSENGKHLYSANYTSGNFSGFTLDADGIIAKESRKTLEFGQNSHPHCCGFTPDGKFLYVVDAGLDRIIFYAYDPGNGIGAAVVRIMELPVASNPRHMFFDAAGKNAYVITEKANDIRRYRWENGCLLPADAVSTLVEKTEKDSSASTLKFAKNGRFLFAGNRGDDSIAVFQIDRNGKLSRQKIVSSGGRSPRDFEFFPDADIIAVANELSGKVDFFHCEQNSGIISDFCGSLEFPRPLYVLV